MCIVFYMVELRKIHMSGYCSRVSHNTSVVVVGRYLERVEGFIFVTGVSCG